MEVRIARILSYILHPLLIPFYSLILLFNLPVLISFGFEAQIWLLAMVFTFTILLPVAVILLMYYLKLVESPELKKSSERTLPLIFTSASYLGLNYVLRGSGVPDYLLYILYGALFTLLTGLLINLAYKVSLHTLGWGAFAASLVGLSIRMSLDIPLVIALVILIAGFVGYSRLKLNAHNPTQVYLGYVAGASIILALTFLL